MTMLWFSIIAALGSLGGCSPPPEITPSAVTTPNAVLPEVLAPSNGSPPLDAVAPPAAAPPVDPEIDALLARLESSADDLRSFTARISYERWDALLERAEQRSGEIVYRLDPDTARKSFAVLFDRMVVGQRQERKLKHFVFDGAWLVEVDHERKQFIKRQIVPPGRQLDPLKLGEGPFPLPIGQKRSEVLARFEVGPAAVPAAGRLRGLSGVHGLALVPRPGTAEAGEFARVELFYDREALLPVGINALAPNGDRKTVLLTDLRRNPELDAAALARLSVQTPDPKVWQIDVREWEE